jgi:hypothetical protein
MHIENDQQITLDSSAKLALSEMGLGSIMHAWKIPFTGYLLSLNQIFLMTRAYQKGAPFSSAFVISVLAASVKALAPLGKKLTPMLAITMQGALFNAGVATLGMNRLGLCLGAVLASLWGFAQPLFLYLLIFGKELIPSYYNAGSLLGLHTPYLEMLFFGCVILKAIFALLIVLLASEEQEMKLQKALAKAPVFPLRPSKAPLIGSLHDLLSLPFLASFVATALWLAQSSSNNWAWYALRVIGASFIASYAARTLSGSKILERLVKKLFPRNPLPLESQPMRESHFGQREFLDRLCDR